jgi:hypothetical protein
VHEEEILPSEGHDPQHVFSAVIVQRDARIAERASELALVAPGPPALARG